MVKEEEKSGQMYEALHVSLISSDKSDTEGNALNTRPLSTWRTDKVSRYFRLLDERWKAGMTFQRLGLSNERTTTGVPQQLLLAMRAD